MNNWQKRSSNEYSHIQKGEFICLLGPSGCVKSTLLNVIAGLERPTSGGVWLDDVPVVGAGPERAMMFQESALFPWLNVLDNVAFPLKIKGVPKQIRERIAREKLRLVHLLRFEGARIHELSGGMRQRAALARALVMDSQTLLMDEPFAALDSQTKQILQNELQSIWIKTEKTIVFVTHSAADDVSLIQTVAEIMKCLKEEVEKVAQAEYDMGWHLEENLGVPHPDTFLGSGL